ncbi:hypothetical protein AAHH17_20595 [Lysinibacillus capsici]
MGIKVIGWLFGFTLLVIICIHALIGSLKKVNTLSGLIPNAYLMRYCPSEASSWLFHVMA